MSLANLLPGFKALSCALKHKDLQTHLHSSRVAELARGLGEKCGLDNEDLTVLQMAASLHDIGKIGIPDAVLYKPAKFDANDWMLMHRHPERGEEIILSLELDHCTDIARAVRQHHENFDGSGYPDGLKGEEIHFLARMVSIVDSYDAMTVYRAYQKPRPHYQTMQVMFGEEGTKSDPYLFQKFTDFIEQSDLKAG